MRSLNPDTDRQIRLLASVYEIISAQPVSHCSLVHYCLALNLLVVIPSGHLATGTSNPCWAAAPADEVLSKVFICSV